MIRRAAALALSALLLGACTGPAGDALGGSTATRTTADNRAWDEILERLKESGSATVHTVVHRDGLIEPSYDSLAHFRLQPRQWRSVEHLASPDSVTAEKRRFVRKVRALDKDTFYVGVSSPRRWRGCWIPTSLEGVARLYEVDNASVMGLPPAVLALLAAEVEPTGDPSAAEFTVHIPASLVLAAIGIPFRRDPDLGPELAQVPVTAQVRIDPAEPRITAAIDGPSLSEDLYRGEVESPRVHYSLTRLSAEINLTGLGGPVRITAPDPSQIVPLDLGFGATCQARGGHAPGLSGVPS